MYEYMAAVWKVAGPNSPRTKTGKLSLFDRFLTFCYLRKGKDWAITKTSPCNEDPLTPHFYSKTMVYRGIHYILIIALKHRLWVLIRTASMRRFLCVPTINVLSKNKKKYVSRFFNRKLSFLQQKKTQYITWACYRNDRLSRAVVQDTMKF